MGLEMNVSKIIESKIVEELRLEVIPRNQCQNYIQENGGNSELITKEEFDSHYRNNHFIDGPYKDTFGDGYGEPYNPHRQAFGMIKEEKIVYCELSESNQIKVKTLLEKV